MTIRRSHKRTWICKLYTTNITTKESTTSLRPQGASGRKIVEKLIAEMDIVFICRLLQFRFVFFVYLRLWIVSEGFSYFPLFTLVICKIKRANFLYPFKKKTNSRNKNTSTYIGNVSITKKSTKKSSWIIWKGVILVLLLAHLWSIYNFAVYMASRYFVRKETSACISCIIIYG